MPVDHTPIPLEEFQGIFSRGYDQNTSDDEVPMDHFCDALNTDFYSDVIGTRFGAHKDHTISNLVRTALYRRTGEAARLLILTWDGVNGKLYDSTNLASVVLTLAGMKDFSCVVLYNNAFISPHNGVTGLAGAVVSIYNGTTIRAALGTAPVGVPTVTNSASVGSVEVGTHLIGVCFETDTGFITPPCTLQPIAAPGGFKIHVANIAIGGASVTARRIVATQVITYNGNPLGYAIFFVPGGRIADNVTTSLDIDFFDVALLTSANYLFDELTSLPAAVCLTTYGTKLIALGENANPSMKRISKNADPESFSSTSGFIVSDPSETAGVICGVEFRSSFYTTKGTHTYITQDNNGEPSTWEEDVVDHGIGTPSPFGIGMLLDNKGANLDYFIVASLPGLQLFNGLYVEKPLSWKIERHWKRINKVYFNLVQVVQDTENKKIYVIVPLDGATTCSHMFVGNYQNGINFKDIRWNIWQFPWSVPAITPFVNVTTSAQELKVGGASNIYSLRSDQLTDDGTAINSYVRFALIYLKNYKNWVHHFWQSAMRVWGSGTLVIKYQGLDASNVLNAPSIALSSSPGTEPNVKLNYKNEKCSVTVQCNNGSDWFKLKSLTLSVKALWANRPA